MIKLKKYLVEFTLEVSVVYDAINEEDARMEAEGFQIEFAPTSMQVDDCQIEDITEVEETE